MNLAEFSALDEGAKIDYFIVALREARNIYSYIRDNCKLGISEATVDELDYIGDILMECGEMAEGGFFDEAFEELNHKLERLRELSGDIGGLLIN